MKLSKEDKTFIATAMLLVLVIGGIFFLPKLFDKPADPLTAQPYEYNGYPFQNIGGSWFTEGQRGNNLFQIATVYGPKELEAVKIAGNPATFIGKKEIYITFDPTESEFNHLVLANAEVSTKLAAHFGIAPLPACTKEAPDCTESNTPIVNCGDQDKIVIFFDQSPGPEVSVVGNCAIIRGERDDIVKAADRFIFGMYGIM